MERGTSVLHKNVILQCWWAHARRTVEDYMIGEFAYLAHRDTA
jgi:hypothetical protein